MWGLERAVNYNSSHDRRLCGVRTNDSARDYRSGSKGRSTDRKCLIDNWRCVAAVVVASKVPVGGLSKCLLPCWVGFLSNCLPTGSFAEVWLERGESTINPNQECPPRFHHREKGICP